MRPRIDQLKSVSLDGNHVRRNSRRVLAHFLRPNRQEGTSRRMTRQMDLFGESAPELPGVESAAAVYRADPDEVRAELLRVLAQARAAQTLPWDARRALYWRTVFPQMTNWLPAEEAAQLRFEFEAEIRRLEAA